MPRLYHSASSIELGRACPYAWALRYIAGWREPSVTWAEIEAGVPFEPRQRSLALGTALHSTAEAWLRAEPAPFAPDSEPVQIFDAGRHNLPHPEACGRVEVEHGIGAIPIDAGDGPSTAIEIHGVLFAGFVDLRALEVPQSERVRLGLKYLAGGVLTVDHKSSSSISRYAKSAEELENDVQASIYGVDTCARFGQVASTQRWVYYQTKGARRSRPVDFTICKDRALEVLEEPAHLAKQLDTITCLEDADQNPRACGDYGGRPCHASLGGPCTVRRSVGALLQLGKKKKDGNNMAEKTSFANKFSRLRAGPIEGVAEAEAPVDVTAEAQPVEEAAEAAPKRRPRPQKAAPKSAKPPKASDQAVAVAKLSEALTRADAAKAQADADLLAAASAYEDAKTKHDAACAAHEAVLNDLRSALSS